MSDLPHNSRPQPFLSAAAIAQMPEQRVVHPLHDTALRHMRSLAAATGCLQLGVHLVRVEPGHDSTAYHRHRGEEEFIYILAGRGVATIDDAAIEVQPGDFMGFCPNSPAHSLHNPFDEDLVYLVGGTDLDYDVIDYPHHGTRLYRVGNRHTYETLEPSQENNATQSD